MQCCSRHRATVPIQRDFKIVFILKKEEKRLGDTAIGVPIREPSRHVLFVDASSTGIAGRKTSFGTRTTSPLSFILRRWVSWRLPRRDSHPRSPRTEPSVATRPEVLVFRPIRPLTWPFHRSYRTSRPRFSARTHFPSSTGKSTATNLPPSISSVDFRWNISRPRGSRSVCSWNEISFICEFCQREIETSDFSPMKFRYVSFFEEIGILIWIFWDLILWF